MITALLMCLGIMHGEVEFADMEHCIEGNDGFVFQLRTFDHDYKSIACDGILTVDFLGSGRATDTRTFNVSKEDYTQVIENAIPMFNVPGKKYLQWESEKIRYDELPEGRPVFGSSVEWPIRCTFEEHGGNKIKVAFQDPLITSR